MLGDNKGAVDVSKHPSHYSKLKHVELRHLHIREVVQRGDAEVKRISTNDNVADIFTKALDKNKFRQIVRQLNIKECPDMSTRGSVGPQALYTSTTVSDRLSDTPGDLWCTCYYELDCESRQ
jgi:hypothetical protein